MNLKILSTSAIFFTCPLIANAAENWNGIYVGGNAGYSWTKSQFNHVENPNVSDEAFTNNLDSGIAGIQIGGRYHLNAAWLVGIEGGGSFLSHKEEKSQTNLNGVLRDRSSQIGDIWQLTASVGYSFGDALAYGKVGYAQTKLKYKTVVVDNNATFGSTDNVGGLVLGVGFEKSLGSGWSAAIEYNYYDFNVGTQEQYNLNTGAYGNADNTNNKLTSQSVIAKINYRF